MSSAWIYQDDKQIKKHGEEKASWYVGWIEPHATHIPDQRSKSTDALALVS